ncbi:MAG: hypothetical protein K5770_07065 [Lachnospiraceae bacterium]|nr:hypothetical protein [Lachnospiraceae bacterium]
MTNEDSDGVAIKAIADHNGTTEVTANEVSGGISAEAKNGGSNTVTVSRDNNGGIDAQAKIGGVNVILIGGNAGGANTEAGLSLTSESGGVNHVVIEGTLTGRDIGVLINENSDNPLPKDTLTVWKIEQPAGNNGDVLAGYKVNGQYVEDEDAEKTIQYIIRVAPPETGVNSLTATKLNGEALEKTTGIGGKDLQWAHEGDIVLLKIDLQEGYSLLGAYGDEGHVELSKDEQTGDYYIKVPRGGGVVLSVSVGTLPVDHDSDGHGSNSSDSDGHDSDGHDPASNSDSKDSSEGQQNQTAGNTGDLSGGSMHYTISNNTTVTLSIDNLKALEKNGVKTLVFHINGITYSISREYISHFLSYFNKNYVEINMTSNGLGLYFKDIEGQKVTLVTLCIDGTGTIKNQGEILKNTLMNIDWRNVFKIAIEGNDTPAAFGTTAITAAFGAFAAFGTPGAATATGTNVDNVNTDNLNQSGGNLENVSGGPSGTVTANVNQASIPGATGVNGTNDATGTNGVNGTNDATGTTNVGLSQTQQSNPIHQLDNDSVEKTMRSFQEQFEQFKQEQDRNNRSLSVSLQPPQSPQTA